MLFDRKNYTFLLNIFLKQEKIILVGGKHAVSRRPTLTHSTEK